MGFASRIRIALALILLSGATSAQPAVEIELLTTSTVENSGLLKRWLEVYQLDESRPLVKAIVSTSGQVFNSVRAGNGDLILTHEANGELSLLRAGLLESRLALMHNHFVLVGPASDTAQASLASNLPQSLRALYRARALFITRADASGTNQKELQMWRAVGIDPETNPNYLANGQGMGATLLMAHELSAYTLSDWATWLSYPQGRRPHLIKSDPSDPLSHNQYSLSPTSHSRPETAYFVAWLCTEGLRLLALWHSAQQSPGFSADACERQPDSGE